MTAVVQHPDIVQLVPPSFETTGSNEPNSSATITQDICVYGKNPGLSEVILNVTPQGVLMKSLENLEYVDPDPPFWTKTSWLQLGYGIWVNLTLMNIGFCIEFSAVAIPQLKQAEIKLPMTKSEEAMIASVLTLSSPLGCVFAGFLLDSFGRKAGLIWCQVPIAVGWLYVAFAKYASGIIFGRVISGIGIGMAMAAPRAYVAEITLPNMRGVLGALPSLAISLGITIQAVLGTFYDWRLLCHLCAAYASILFFVNILLPDTPYFILLKSTASEAKLALKRFRSSKYNIEGELQTLQEFKTVNHIRRLSICETRKAMMKSSTCKPFGIILFYIALHQFAGTNVVTTWGVEILQLAHSSVDPHWGNVSLGVTRIIVGILTSFLLFRVGRRPLAMVSAVGVGGAGIMLGGYLHTDQGGLSPVLFMVAFMAFAVPGYHTLPTMMMFELFPLQLRGLLSGIILSISNILMFGVIHIYPSLRDSIGMANTFIAYGVISLIGAFVLYLILPETKELTLQEIEEYFNHRRSTLISDRRLLSMQLSMQLRSQIMSKINEQEQSREPSLVKLKKKKRLRIVSSENVYESRRESRNDSVDIKRASFEDMITVYDENDKYYKKDNSEQSEKLTKDTTERKTNRKKSKSKDEKDNTKKQERVDEQEEKENVGGEESDKKEPDDINKPGTSGI